MIEAMIAPPLIEPKSFPPSQVHLDDAVPLVGTFGRAESEMAAALLVRACHARGDKWQPISPEELLEVITDDIATQAAPTYSWSKNPFFRPDVTKLIEHGFAQYVGDPLAHVVAFTGVGIARLAKWVLPPLPVVR